MTKSKAQLGCFIKNVNPYLEFIQRFDEINTYKVPYCYVRAAQGLLRAASQIDVLIVGMYNRYGM